MLITPPLICANVGGGGGLAHPISTSINGLAGLGWGVEPHMTALVSQWVVWAVWGGGVVPFISASVENCIEGVDLISAHVQSPHTASDNNLDHKSTYRTVSYRTIPPDMPSCK